jgi:hypothetical protein
LFVKKNRDKDGTFNEGITWPKSTKNKKNPALKKSKKVAKNEKSIDSFSEKVSISND